MVLLLGLSPMILFLWQQQVVFVRSWEVMGTLQLHVCVLRCMRFQKNLVLLSLKILHQDFLNQLSTCYFCAQTSLCRHYFGILYFGGVSANTLCSTKVKGDAFCAPMTFPLRGLNNALPKRHTIKSITRSGYICDRYFVAWRQQ